MTRLPLPALAAVLLLAGCGAGGPGQTDRNRAVTEAVQAYHEATANGVNMSRGPCIAEQLPDLPDWVVDIAHETRQPVDDQPANQCARYRDGQAHHFVELDPQGHVIRAQ